MTPRGIRNNNPGNIRGSSTQWQGQTGVDDLGFAIFDSPESGIRAMAMTLLTYQNQHGLDTISQIINRWAPPTENNTEAYVESVCATCRASPTNPYPLTTMHLIPLVMAIIKHENGEQPYDADQIESGVDQALDS